MHNRISKIGKAGRIPRHAHQAKDKQKNNRICKIASGMICRIKEIES